MAAADTPIIAQQAEQLAGLRRILTEIAHIARNFDALAPMAIDRLARDGLELASAGHAWAPPPASRSAERLQADLTSAQQLIGDMRQHFAHMMRQRDAAQAQAGRLRILIREYRAARDQLVNEHEQLSDAELLRLIRQRRAADGALDEELAPQYIAAIEQPPPPPTEQSQLAAFGIIQALGTCPRCGSWLDNVTRGISSIAGGQVVCTACLSPGEIEQARARRVE